MRDFILRIFKFLYLEFQRQGYKFITFSDYCLNNRPEKLVIIRHDVDRKAGYALKIAKLENSLGTQSFRW